MIELKSRFDGDLRLAARAADVLAGYRGPVAAMSFDPGLIAALRDLAPALCPAAWSPSASAVTPEWRAVLQAARTPQFLAYLQHALGRARARNSSPIAADMDLPRGGPPLCAHS